MTAVNGHSEAVHEANRMRRERRRAENRQSFRLAYDAFGQYLVPTEPLNYVGTSGGYQSLEALRDSGRAAARGRVGSDYYARELDALRAESQRMDRDNCIYQAMLTRVSDVVLGEYGPNGSPGTSSREWNKKATSLWDAWWYGLPEIRQMDDGPSTLRKILRHYLCDGDHLINRVESSGDVQLIVADQLYTNAQGKLPNGNLLRCGVELNTDRAPVRFHVCQFDDWGGISYSSPAVIEARHCTFIANRRRIEQTRGEPVMQAAFPMLRRIDDVCTSEAAAWQLLSRIALQINEDDQQQRALNTSLPAQKTDGADADFRYQDYGVALVFHGSKGSKISGVDRNIPGNNFVESLKMFLRLVGMSLGFSLEFVLLIWSDTNYSSGRASIKQVERNCKPYRAAIDRVLCDIYRWKVSQWIESGELENIDGWDKVTWHFPPYPFLDPEKEASARAASIKSGQTTPQQAALEDGTTLDDRIAAISEAMDSIAKAVDAHNDRHPNNPLTIADFIPRGGEEFAPPAAVVPSLAATEEGQ